MTKKIELLESDGATLMRGTSEGPDIPSIARDLAGLMKGRRDLPHTLILIDAEPLLLHRSYAVLHRQCFGQILGPWRLIAQGEKAPAVVWISIADKAIESISLSEAKAA